MRLLPAIETVRFGRNLVTSNDLRKKLRYDILDLTKSDNITFVQTPSGFPRKSTLHSYPNEENCSQELMDASLSQDCRTNEEEFEKSREEWHFSNNLNNK